MRKLIFLAISIMFFSSCSETGKIEIDLSNGIQEVPLIPNRYLTTKCHLRINGDANCNFSVKIPSENSIVFDEGEISFTKSYEWFDKGKTIIIIPDSCESKSKIAISYSYSAGYFGT